MTDEGQVGRSIARGGGHAVWRQIVEHLVADIDAGRLQPGARLPNETTLAETFSVNRHTVRRALSELAAKGLVFNRPDPAPFRDKLRSAGFYTEWKAKYGDEAWALLEKSVGKLS